ncbi:MAG: ABC transporter substrate-binding protein [Halarsenatibacteraceae bacterium]
MVKLFKSNSIIFIIVILSIFIISTAGQTSSTRQVTDMLGREVEIPSEINRIATSYTPATLFVVALGAQDKLVAAGKGMPKQQIFNELAPEIEDLPEISGGSGINLESVAALDPDLIIISPHGGAAAEADRLESIGYPTVIINPEGFYQVAETFEFLGKTLNLEEKAAEISGLYQEIEEITAKTRELSDSEKKRVYFANSQLLDTVGANMLQSDLIKIAGGINPAEEVKSGFIEASSEQLIEWDPDLVILSQFYRGELADLYDSPGYQGIAAFKSNNLKRIPSNIEPWDFPGPASGLISVWLAEKLYPEHYSELDLLKFTDKFYNKIYGQTFSELTENYNERSGEGGS